MSTISDMLSDAEQIASENPNDIAQGMCRVTLTNGERITGRVQGVYEDGFSFYENEHTGYEPDFALFVRLDAVVTFQYVGVPVSLKGK